MKRCLPLLLCALQAMPAHAGTLDANTHKTPPEAYYAALPAGYRLTEREKREVLELSGWPRHLHGEALRVIDCESYHGVVDAVGDGGLAQGIFQVHWYGWTKGYPEAFTDFEGEPFNPVDNARLALRIYERSAEHGDGWFNWSCSHE